MPPTHNDVRHRTPLTVSLREEAIPYLIKAVLLVICLMAAGFCAPILPAPILALILVVFALVSTIGALYHTVVKRTYRQNKLIESGSLSRFNRKWTIKLIAFFLISSISGFLFLLEAPKWDLLEWVLLWVAIPLYFVVFTVAQHNLKKEFAPEYYKAYAMRWSFWIVGAALCLAYAALSFQPSGIGFASLTDAFQAIHVPFENSPSALMNEVGKLPPLAEGLTAYALDQIQGHLIAITFIYRIVVFASVFFGLVNQFGACLLTKNDLKSEFSLLPSPQTNASETEFVKRYAIALVLLSVIVFAAIMIGDYEVRKAQETSEHTAIESFVEDTSNCLIRQFDLEHYYLQQEKELFTERSSALTPLINEYYDRCLENVDSYLNWYESPFGGAAKLLKPLPFGNPLAGFAKDSFINEITKGVSDEDIQTTYSNYSKQYDDLEQKKWAELDRNNVQESNEISDSPDTPDNASNAENEDKLNLWMPLTGNESGTVIKDTLLNTDEDTNRETMRSKIMELIEKARSDTFSYLNRGW